ASRGPGSGRRSSTGRRCTTPTRTSPLRLPANASIQGEAPMSLPDHTTLNWGPWYRRTPFFGAPPRARCSAYDVYQHMYHPNTYGDPVEEYWALVNDVTLWDV